MRYDKYLADLVFLGPYCKLRTFFFVRIYGLSGKGKKLGPQLTVQLSNSVSKGYNLANV